MAAGRGTRCTLTDLDRVRIIVTVASESPAHLQHILNELQELAGGHPAVLSICTEGDGDA